MTLDWSKKSNLAKLPHKQQVQLAIYAAELVVDLVDAEHRPGALQCIKVAKKWLRGEATTEESVAVTNNYSCSFGHNIWANWAAVWAGSVYYGDSRAVTNTIGNIIRATEASTIPEETIDKIYTHYDNLLNIDKYVEEAFLTD